MKEIQYKLNGFPKHSETFILTNIFYAQRNNFKIKIYVNEFLGVDSSSQKKLFRQFEIENYLEKPRKLKSNYFSKLFIYIKCLLNFRVLKFFINNYNSVDLKKTSFILYLDYFSSFENKLTHIHFNTAIEPLNFLQKIGYINSKYIVTFHGYDAYMDTKESFKKKYDFFYENVIAVTSNSEFLKKQLIKIGIPKEKIFVIPMGIDTSYFKGVNKSISQNQIIKLITVGRLIQLKGHKYGILAVNELIKKGYNCEYNIIGDGAELENLKIMVEFYNLQKYIVFHGSMEQKEIIKLLSQSDLFLMTSTFEDSTGRREAFGLVSIEAQSMGLPVIGFKSGGFQETILEGITGFSVDDRNYNEMANKVELFIKNKKKYSDASAQAIIHAKKFDLKFTMKCFLDLYKRYNF
jgi:colanic acid/amylovoran biosynthesis glycosyltransferase